MLSVLLLNTYDNTGGAARAAYRLHEGLLELNVDSKMFVQSKKTDSPRITGPYSRFDKFFEVVRPHMDRAPLAFYRNREVVPYDLQWLPGGQQTKINHATSDIIHLHWINAGFISIETLSRLRKPLIWTLHDMWAFTGGCSYAYTCEGYFGMCGHCPQLASSTQNDLSRWTWTRKQKAWRDLKIHIVTPSRWLAECARKSALFKDRQIDVIPNGLDIEKFKPIPKATAREILNLPKNKKILLFGAVKAIANTIKGIQILPKALSEAFRSGIASQAELVIFGMSRPNDPPDFHIATRYMGYLSDDVSLALLYSAADVMIVPSFYEAFGQTASEAMACGCPVVAFYTSGLLDIVDHKQNGYLAKAFDPVDLGQGIAWVLQDEDKLKQLGLQARLKAERDFDIKKIAKLYFELYQKVLKV